ncbi:MAG: ATP-dependent DNA helicase RecQ [Bacteroidales bacterium]|nr:ATP-dependent DNA helicase RecQ [Bacteroidales bacterium]
MTYLEILKQYWGYDHFRGVQEEIIDSIGSGHDTLGLMPTGGGKSITFQVPAMAKDGLCLVVSPLIALMKDQVRILRQKGIKAIAVYSGMSHNEILVALENCIFGNYKFLYISPERLASDIFRIKMRHMHISMITVDESHCISQWGYDFRPAYLKIAEIRALLPNVPVLALTATATPKVVNDIQQKLAFREGSRVCQMSFARDNLAYVVRKTENKPKELLHVLNKVEGTAIVYAHSRKRTQEVAQFLNDNNISASFFHAGLNNEEKDIRQKAWITDKTRVIVATNAFGMGIDKPDVRLVIHFDIPDSPEAYYQEAGRAGRDGQKAYAVLLYAEGDKQTLLRRITDTYPDPDYIRKVYEDVNYYLQMAMGDGLGCTREIDLAKFCYIYKHFPTRAESALHILTQAGYLEYTEEQDNVSRLMFTIKREELYRLQEFDEGTDKLIRTIFRSYTGLFTEYVYIDEGVLSIRTGLGQNFIYQVLKTLSHRRIVSYIPRRRTPYIIYTRERQETTNIVLTPEIYDKRKDNFSQRIQAMIEYATSSTKCRNSMLLHYFGERSFHPCGKCDICCGSNAKTQSAESLMAVRQTLLARLKNGPISMGALPVEWSDVVSLLIKENELKLTDGLLSVS